MWMCNGFQLEDLAATLAQHVLAATVITVGCRGQPSRKETSCTEVPHHTAMF